MCVYVCGVEGMYYSCLQISISENRSDKKILLTSTHDSFFKKSQISDTMAKCQYVPVSYFRREQTMGQGHSTRLQLSNSVAARASDPVCTLNGGKNTLTTKKNVFGE